MTRRLALTPTDHVITVLGEPTRRWRGSTAGGIEVAVFCSGIVAWQRQDGERLIEELGTLLGTVDPPRVTTPAFTNSAAELDAYRRCIATLLHCRPPDGAPGPDDATLRALLVSTMTASNAALVLR